MVMTLASYRWAILRLVESKGHWFVCWMKIGRVELNERMDWIGIDNVGGLVSGPSWNVRFRSFRSSIMYKHGRMT